MIKAVVNSISFLINAGRLFQREEKPFSPFEAGRKNAFFVRDVLNAILSSGVCCHTRKG
jgi:hypothetical protein